MRTPRQHGAARRQHPIATATATVRRVRGRDWTQPSRGDEGEGQTATGTRAAEGLPERESVIPWTWTAVLWCTIWMSDVRPLVNQEPAGFAVAVGTWTGRRRETYAGDRSEMENAVRPLDDVSAGSLGLSWSWERTARAGSPGRASTSRFLRVQSVGICCGRGRVVAWSPGGAATGQSSAISGQPRWAKAGTRRLTEYGLGALSTAHLEEELGNGDGIRLGNASNPLSRGGKL